jgi:hypothetical protein
MRWKIKKFSGNIAIEVVEAIKPLPPNRASRRGGHGNIIKTF